MPLSYYLSELLQIVALALSIFNLIAFFWLASTVWLNGNRRSLIVVVGVIGLCLSALFFFIHTLLVANPIEQASGPAEFFWYLIWLPALGVPYIWFFIGLHYAALINERWRRRRPWLLVASALSGMSVLVVLILNWTAFTFEETLRVLNYGDKLIDPNVGWFSPKIWLPALFLLYITFCAIGPWFTLGRVGRLCYVLWRICTGGYKGQTSLRRLLADAFWDDQTNVEMLEEPVLSWHLARPGLLLAALLMVGLTTSLGILGARSMIYWFSVQRDASVFRPTIPDVVPPPRLVELDIFAGGSIALMILLIGYSVVRHGILIERPLARRGFFEQWRGVVIVATTIALLIAIPVGLTHSNNLSVLLLLLVTSLTTVVYALFTWSNYTAHDRYIALLGPFLRNTNLRHWLNTDLHKTEQSMEALFFHLCQDVLEVQCARLLVLTGSVRRSFSYLWPTFDGQTELPVGGDEFNRVAMNVDEKRETHSIGRNNGLGKTMAVNPRRVRMKLQGQPMVCWVLPIYDDLGLVAMLYLGPRQDGAVFTDEDMDLAHACGQRILDTLRDHEAMQAVAELLRHRIVDVKLLGAQQRRVLHDEILPQMHLALLRLETLRPCVSAEHTSPMNIQPEQTLNETVEIITDAHRRLAAMMRATATSAPHRLERDGMMRAIHTMVKQDFQHTFDEVKWTVSEETASHIDEIVPPAIAELIFAAVQEALRNAARHARGSDVHRRLCLTLTASCDPHLEVVVADDGVGIVSASSSTTGTGGGLLTHSALLAIAGGSLTVKSAPGEGVTIRILLPAEALR